ncbi:MAG: invasion associated locus B family protein [Pseudomonadales bacterium]|jgi:invasion protein IalB|nr:invasion associated locus B family protein [Pseudomonadales bacterium]
MNLQYKIIQSFILAIAASAAWSASAPSNPGLPGGASSLQETYDDWTVACVVQAAGKTCAMQQEQHVQQSGQLVLAAELRPAGTGVGGTLVLPFGLALAKGATVQIDEGAVSAPLAFSTCVPVGCVVPVSFDAKMLDGLRKGVAFKIKVVPDGGGDAAQFAVSLKGFSAAFDRVAALLK